MRSEQEIRLEIEKMKAELEKLKKLPDYVEVIPFGIGLPRANKDAIKELSWMKNTMEWILQDAL